ncbi:hypothetical protein MVLG_04565 [Microbotryum lychnidis-dioicae p1A1 Lamole]|uniref:Uncharacterized protein n=1 Tax=Microbotryum lychnidis-dioicae (strain p1A1 Lamole / MvSl-1064) TaxID=683840 RepID=U5HBL6_USTV1|nr:hypothetical protein MVLG_04565 [Microbotryum lychnidis-dioicae p1A1 Lamole]|eukprot:KDE05021.1 hypothetical protein MVLG_04565 [Microbotryum lychnidis-dioicae p1A1 Lamole]
MDEGSSSLPQVNHPHSCRCLVRKLSPIGTRSNLGRSSDPAPAPAPGVADNESSTTASSSSHVDSSAWHRSNDHPRSYNDPTRVESLVAPSLSRSSTWELITPGMDDSTVKLEGEVNASHESDSTTSTTSTSHELTQLILELGNQLESLNTTERPLVQGSPRKTATAATTSPVITGKADPRFESAISNLAQSLILHYHSNVTPELVSPTHARSRLYFAFENLVELGLEMAQIAPSSEHYAQQVVEDLFPLDRCAAAGQDLESIRPPCSTRPGTEPSPSSIHASVSLASLRVLQREVESVQEQVERLAQAHGQLAAEVVASEKAATTNRLILARLNHLDTNTTMHQSTQNGPDHSTRQILARMQAQMEHEAAAREKLATTNRLILARLNHLESNTARHGRAGPESDHSTRQSLARMQAQMENDAAAREKLATTNRLILARLNHLDTNTLIRAEPDEGMRSSLARIEARMGDEAAARESLAATNRLILARLNHPGTDARHE